MAKPQAPPLSPWILYWKDYQAQRQAIEVDADAGATGIEVIHDLLNELLEGPGLGEANPCWGYVLLDTRNGEELAIDIRRSVVPYWGELIPRLDPTEEPLDPTAETLQKLRAAAARTSRLLPN